MAASRNRRPGFSRRAQYGLFFSYVVAIGGALIGAILLILGTVAPTAFAGLRGAAAEVTVPASSVFGSIGRGIAAIPEAVGSHFAIRSENQRLKLELARAQALVQRARTLSYDNRRLRRLLEVREGVAEPIVVARLVSSTPSSTRRLALLNAGTRDGVHSGQPVRGPDGLIGRVTEVSSNTARVLLLTDPESTIPVRRTSDGYPAIAAGRGDGLLDIRAISTASAPFKVGDVFVTSGTGGVFAPNIPVARVIARSRDAGLARTFAHPDTLDFALVQSPFVPPMPPPPPAPQP